MSPAVCHAVNFAVIWRPLPIAALASAALLALGGCNGDAPAATETGGNVTAAQVLDGTISDGMLQTEDLQSQPPVAAPLPGEESAASGSSVAADAGPDGASSGAPASPEDPAPSQPATDAAPGGDAAEPAAD